MKTTFLIASGIILAALANAAVPSPAHALTMAECSAKYKEAKTAGTLNGMKWNDFRKSQCGAEAGAPPPVAEKKAEP
ncbi:MAG: antifreeze protein, partial [Xanthobacteraceae bacterium]